MIQVIIKQHMTNDRRCKYCSANQALLVKIDESYDPCCEKTSYESRVRHAFYLKHSNDDERGDKLTQVARNGEMLQQLFRSIHKSDVHLKMSGILES